VTPPIRGRLDAGQRYTLALGLLVSLLLLTVSLPSLYREPDAPPAAAATVAPASPEASRSAVEVVRPEVPTAARALAIVLSVLLVLTLAWGWSGAARTHLRRPRPDLPPG
jgi:hypothetical protein